MDTNAVATPLKGGTDTIAELTFGSGLHTPAQEDSHIGAPGHNHSASSFLEMPSAHSTDSSSTNSSTTSHTSLNNGSSRAVSPLTPPSTQDTGPKGQNPMICEANQKGKDSQQSIVKILQSVQFQGSGGVAHRPSTPGPEAYVEFGTGSFVYPSDYEFNFEPSLGQDSPTPRNVIAKGLNTTAKHNSTRLDVPEIESSDSNSCLETEDARVENPRVTKKARKRGSSVSPTTSLSEDANQQLINGPSVIPIAIPTARSPSRDSSPNGSATPYPQASPETTDSFVTLPEDEVLVSPSDDVVAASHNLPKAKSNKAKGRPQKSKGTPNKPNGSTPELKLRRSPRLEENRKKSDISANIGPSVEESYFPPNSNEIAASQNLCEGVSSKFRAGAPKLDEDEATTDECQASTTSGQAPYTIDQETNSDTKAADAVVPPVNARKKPGVDTTKKTGSIEFEQYKEIESPVDTKIAILNVILQEDKKHSLDKEKGFVYIYKLGSSEGHVKIGKSKQKHGLRVKQWAQSCKLPFERISDLNDKRFMHYGIVEKLIHTELSKERKMYECETCKRKGRKQLEDPGVDHTEWFEVTEKHALEVVERWRGWLVRHQPYDKDGALRRIWVWKHGQLSEATTADYKEWVILTWSDWSAYSWYRIDSYLDEEIPTVLRSSLFINGALVFVTRLWCVSGAFVSSVFTMVILAMFLKYS
ncbi:hypothetical protein VE03_00313 [Pseudogymnoascus sp. 23342-1-I1]|nr:hypothetical protein VE03_00313 [Pseudogymnoascus sp. 23342-1-I1]